MLRTELPQSMTRRRLLIGAGAAIALGAAACGAPAAPSPAAPAKATAPPRPTPANPTPAASAAAPTSAAKPAAPTAAAKPAGLTPLRPVLDWKDGIIPVPALFWPQHVAAAEGIYQDLGLNVETTQMGGDIAALKAMIANELQSGMFTPFATLVSIAQGAGVRIIGSPEPGLPHVLFVQRETESVEEFKGKTLGIAGQGGLSHTLLLALLEQESISPNDVSFLDITQGGANALFQALIQGKIDAMVAPVDFQLNIRPEDNAKMLLSFRDRVPGVIRVTVTSEKMIREQPEALARLVGGQVLATRLLLEKRDRAIDILAKVSGQERDQVAWTYDKYVELNLFDPNYRIDPAAITFMQELNVKLGNQEKVVPPSGAIDLSIQRKVIESLGEYRKPS